ncbi:uncharacterized protein PRCAT00002887001 [Priceomyces carsonii]|uniref:uncharacterized protein n=1 Tax=Priceomyces carsonii TaxID=28549 RepID=UPI002EDBB430|nr:unnamed protein product [Priceomyces carsonii]
MPPLYVKGGVWTNVEDEILKAAVSKYGLNQWSRVASLLTKKNAKQAKARWNEWVSPGINRKEWTREEDEELLKLVRLMPNQWRSIAPVLGRTATQCVERYHILLEDVADDLSVTGPGIETLPASGQTGDLNINPESKAAKPDEEELDDDEREMLSEARARLANTKGKKAQRKERERMLEESKRIALLQKRRELKAAGINVSLQSKNKKKRKEFDYNADIPHEHEIPKGFHDTSEEVELNEKEKLNFNRDVNTRGMDFKEVDDKIKRDKKRLQKEIEIEKKKRKHETETAASLTNDISDENLKRRKLELPKPEVRERESLIPFQVDLDTQHLEGIFAKGNLVEIEDDADERIRNATRKLVENQMLKSSLVASEGPVSFEEKTTSENQTLKVSKKEIILLLVSSFKELPNPQNSPTIILPSFDATQESLTNFENEATSFNGDERKKNLKILKKVELEEAKLRRSRAVQKGLPIPKPMYLKDIKLDGLDGKIYEEMKKLIASDYSKYVDPLYKTELLDDLDEISFKTVNAEVKSELKETPAEEPVTDSIFSLPRTFEVAEKIIALLHDFRQKCLHIEESITSEVGYSDFIDKMDALKEELDENFLALEDADIELNNLIAIKGEEDNIIDRRSKRLHELSDFIKQAESKAQDRVRSIRINSANM